MGIHYVDYAGESEGRGPSLAVWNPFLGAKAQVDNYMFGSGSRIIADDFMDDHDLTNSWTLTQATTGTFALTDAVHGVALLDCNSTTAAQGANLQYMSTVGERVLPAAGRTIVLESRVKAADIATGPEFFFGLHTVDTTIIASSDLSDGTGQSFAGFGSVTDDGVLVSFTANNTSRTVGTTTLHTLVDDTYVKLGIVINGVTNVEFYVNGDLKETVTTTVPAEEMAVSYVCQSGGTTDPIVHIDWVLGYQLDALD